MVARSRNGEIKAFPVVETIHKDNICHTTEAPARVPPQVQLHAQQVASQAVACLEGGALSHTPPSLTPSLTLAWPSLPSLPTPCPPTAQPGPLSSSTPCHHVSS